MYTKTMTSTHIVTAHITLKAVIKKLNLDTHLGAVTRRRMLVIQGSIEYACSHVFHITRCSTICAFQHTEGARNEESLLAFI